MKAAKNDDQEQPAKAKRVFEAKLLEQYVDHDTGKRVYHPRADHVRNKHGEPDESSGKRILRGGSQIFNTGPQGGPAVELNFTDWTPLPEGRGGLFVVRFLRSDPIESARVKIRSRPAVEDMSDLLSDDGIEHLDSAAYTQRMREESSKSQPAPGMKKARGRPRTVNA